MERMIRTARPFILIVGLFGLWWLAAILVEALTGKGRFLLPTPDLVWAAFVENPAYFLKGFRVTLIEVALGLLIGAALGLWLTLVLAVSKHLRFWLLPLLVISQAIPVFALAPLLVQWLGWGLAPKIAMTTLILFFPVTMAFWSAFKAVDKDMVDVARVFGANRWQLLRKVYLPLALPGGLNGLKAAAAIAPIGAFIGELVGGQQVGGAYGLGYVILRELKINARTDTMMVAVVFMVLLALGLYGLVSLIAARAAAWSENDLKPLET